MIHLEIDTTSTEREQDIMSAIDGVMRLLPEQFNLRWMGTERKTPLFSEDELRVVLLEHDAVSWSSTPYERFTCTCGKTFAGPYNYAKGLAHAHLLEMWAEKKSLAEKLLP